jgi:hypothetical protein
LRLALLTEAQQPAHKHRIGLQRGGLVDQPVQQLVVAHRRDVELLPDRRLLGAVVLPLVALELEDLSVTLVELVGLVLGLDRGHARTVGAATDSAVDVRRDDMAGKFEIYKDRRARSGSD